MQEQLESAKKPDENAGDDDDKLAGEVTPEQEFERLYGVSVEDFREEYGDVQATMFLNQVSENLVLKQQLGEVNSAFKSQQEQEQANVQQSLQDAIDANPVLSDIQQNNPALWEAAVAMNGYLLKTDDEYFEKGFAERMSYIAEQISPSKTSTGSEDKPANGEIPKPEPKTPTSLTDFPGSGESVDQTELDRIASMSDGELDRVMADPVMADRILANL
ncbi:MAG TPA: hypothetical protein ENJ24_01875 [Gammaproteobacteria bacterium]|nr:hypothetical protein [Gammaproteobacteria bacterium]